MNKTIVKPKETTIRNYQGKIPPGKWYCGSCNFECKLLEDAASHSNKYNVWIFLIPDNPQDKTFEIHPSDFDGVYLNSYYKDLTFNDIRKVRSNFKHKEF